MTETRKRAREDDATADQQPVEKKAKTTDDRQPPKGRVLLRLASGAPAATLYPCGTVFTKEEADRCYEHMRTKYPWKHDSIVLAGKTVREPRLTCQHSLTGGTYRYSGKTKTAVPFDEVALFMRQRVKEVLGVETDYELNNNYVKAEKHQIHFHADDETDMAKDAPIISKSFGHTRRFVVKRKHKLPTDKVNKAVLEVYLRHGDVLVMHPGMQREFVHGVPLPTKKEESLYGSEPWKHRFNCTGRVLKSSKTQMEESKGGAVCIV